MRLQHAVKKVTTRVKAVKMKKSFTTRVSPDVLMAIIEVQIGIANVL
jgi:hypothetical protein